MITAAQFNVDFPEFADVIAFPPSRINFWLNVASQLMNQDRWGAPAAKGQSGTLFDVGQELFVAHFMTTGARAQAVVDNGGIPGEMTGPVNSKGVDKVSVSYTTSEATASNADHWNLSVYGVQYIHLARLVGFGPIQVGIGVADPLSGAFAYPGPWTFNFPNMNL
ncbi:MAG: DUF4054 domain-containing protein [Candidatus Dormibacteraceae bacterium]